MKANDRLLQRILQDLVIPLAANAAALKQKVPKRVGGYILPLDDIMAQLGRNRETISLLASIQTHLVWMLGRAINGIEYAEHARGFILHFNDKLTLSKEFVHFDTTAYPHPGAGVQHEILEP